MSVIHIYRIPQVVELTMGSGGTLMNYPVNRSDFVLYRHVDNEIDFWLKNIDRKPINATGGTLTLNIRDPRTERNILSKTLSLVDAATGHARLTITEVEATELAPLTFEYSVSYLRTDGMEVLLYTDRNRRANGIVEVLEGPIYDVPEPVEIAFSTFASRNSKFYSGAYEGAANVNNYSGLHTAAISMTNFTGIVTVQASLDESPSSLDVNWFDVEAFNYTAQTGLQSITVEGNFLWVRFVLTIGSGSVSNISYKN